jgi:hypothetical protein
MDLLLVFILIGSFFNLVTSNWEGSWTVATPCFGNCCCPNTNSIIHFKSNPTNSSEVLVVGAFDAGISRECAMLMWLAGIEIPWPFSVNNFTAVPKQLTDEDGIVYNISGQKFANGTAVGYIRMDQTAIDGDQSCGFALTNIVSGWNGPWQVNIPCENTLYCCCPANKSIVSITADPKNSSQIIVSGKFETSDVCKNLGWSSGKASWPWGNNAFDPDDQDDLEVMDKAGIRYTVTVTETLELNYEAFIEMDQFTAGGAAKCRLGLARQSIHMKSLDI